MKKIDIGSHSRLVKDPDTFGGSDMWNLEIKGRYGCWRSVQWMSASSAEEHLPEGVSLPRFKKKGHKLVEIEG